MAEKKSGKKIIDVQHADKTPTAATSKPVIVTNRPILQDPMVVDKTDEEEPAAKTTGGQTIQPLTAPEVPAEDTKEEPAPEEPVKEQPVLKKSAPKLEPTKTLAEIDAEVKAKPKKEEPAKPAESEKPEAEDVQEETDKQAPKDEQSEVDKVDKAAKHEAELQSLVDSKKYFLPINSVEKRRSKQVVISGILLSVLLAVLWVDIALDAGLIKLGGLKSLTHFFST